jgi:cell division septation protein DedD
MAENRRGKGLYYLSRGQLAIIAAGFTVTSVVVFFLGILVGQGIEGGKSAKPEEPLVKIPVQPLSSGVNVGTPAKEEMTFYDTLAKAPTPGEKESRPAVEATKTPEKAAKPAVKEKPPAATEKVQEKAKAERPRGKWSVQVNAYAEKRDAESLVKKLTDKGYDAYVVSTNIKGRTWYRVRVGRLATRQEARNLQQTLMRKEKFAKAFATSR